MWTLFGRAGGPGTPFRTVSGLFWGSGLFGPGDLSARPGGFPRKVPKERDDPGTEPEPETGNRNRPFRLNKMFHRGKKRHNRKPDIPCTYRLKLKGPKCAVLGHCISMHFSGVFGPFNQLFGDIFFGGGQNGILWPSKCTFWKFVLRLFSGHSLK